MKYGLILDEKQPEDYQFGSAVSLGSEMLVPDGDWAPWLPIDEYQNLAMEPMACTSFGTFNCLEALVCFEYRITINYSDRFLAYTSGTTQYGNSPKTVIDTLRKKGSVTEDLWPYTPDINTWTKFYATPPQNLYTKAVALLAEFSIGYEFVSNTQAAMMEALKHSPLGVSVYAWDAPDNDGIYHRPQFAQSNHWTMCYGYVPNQYWKIFDSYDNSHKRLAWDFGFEQVFGYTLHRQIVSESWFQKFLHLIGL